MGRRVNDEALDMLFRDHDERERRRDRQTQLESSGAYLIIAACAMGRGPPSGFDNAKVDEEFSAAGKPCEARSVL